MKYFLIKTLQKKIYPVKLMVVTKGRSLQDVEKVIAQGATLLGENTWQEIQEKYDSTLFRKMRIKGIALHFVGHLQKNKVKNIVRVCDGIQSVDSFSLAEKINREAGLINKKMPIFLELNLSMEKQKYGFDEKTLKTVFPSLRALLHLDIQGLMCIGKEGDHTMTRQIFRRCKSICEEFRVSECSMGMSDDYQIAIEEGSTLVRLGRKIFEEHESCEIILDPVVSSRNH